jgi:hypothetical protein
MRRGSSSTGPGPGSGADEVCWTDVTRWFSHGSVYLQRNLDQSTGKAALFSIFTYFVILKLKFALASSCSFCSSSLCAMFKILISYSNFSYVCLITYSVDTLVFFSGKYKLEVVGESVVCTHLMKHRRNEYVSFLGYHGVSFRDQFLTCRMAVVPSYCRLSNLRISPGLFDRQHEGCTIPLNARKCSHGRQNLYDTVYCRECRT